MKNEMKAKGFLQIVSMVVFLFTTLLMSAILTIFQFSFFNAYPSLPASFFLALALLLFVFTALVLSIVERKNPTRLVQITLIIFVVESLLYPSIIITYFFYLLIYYYHYVAILAYVICALFFITFVLSLLTLMKKSQRMMKVAWFCENILVLGYFTYFIMIISFYLGVYSWIALIPYSVFMLIRAIFSYLVITRSNI